MTVDGTGGPVRELPCDFTYTVPCGDVTAGRLEANTTSLANGTHSFTVTVKDAAGNRTTSAARTFTVNNSIFHAQQLDGDPAAGGGLLAEEWVIPGTRVARREIADTTTNRGIVGCQAADGGRWCSEVHWRTLDSQLDGAGAEDLDTFASHTGASVDDPNLPEIADLTAPEGYAGITPVATGAIGSAVASWQVLPPGHGTTYAAYDLPWDVVVNSGAFDQTTGEYPPGHEPAQATLRVWIDAQTRMPLKMTVVRRPGPPTGPTIPRSPSPAITRRTSSWWGRRRRPPCGRQSSTAVTRTSVQ